MCICRSIIVASVFGSVCVCLVSRSWNLSRAVCLMVRHSSSLAVILCLSSFSFMRCSALIVLVGVCLLLVSVMCIVPVVRCLRWYSSSSFRILSLGIQLVVLISSSVSPSVTYSMSNWFLDSLAVALLCDWIFPSSGGCHWVLSFVRLSCCPVITDFSPLYLLTGSVCARR